MTTAIRVPLLPVQSSNIKAVGYDDDKAILAIEFVSGDIFHYAGVHADLALALYQAESVGKYYTSTIRGKFDGDKMTGPCGSCRLKGWIGDLCPCGVGAFQREEYIPNGSEAKGRGGRGPANDVLEGGSGPGAGSGGDRGVRRQPDRSGGAGQERPRASGRGRTPVGAGDGGPGPARAARGKRNV